MNNATAGMKNSSRFGLPGKLLAALALTTSSLLLLTGCISETAPDPNETAITVYSGRSEELVADLFEQFTAETGIQIQARYGDSAELSAQILEEGQNSPADVFFSQDAGALGALSAAGVLVQLPEELLELVPSEYRASDSSWVGVSGRSRVLSYNPNLVSELPTSVLELADPKWQGKIGIAPSNASFQAFVTGLRVLKGDAVATEFLAGMKKNAVLFEKNSQILDAVEAGQIALGLINHYYWYEKSAEIGADNMVSKITWFSAGDPGNLVNVAGVGVLSDSAAAEQFAAWLLGETAQLYFVNQTFEYSLTSASVTAGLRPLSELEGPSIDLNDLATLSETLELIRDAGLN